MAKAKSRADKKDSGVYVSLAELIKLQHQAAGFSFLPGQPIQSLLAGRHNSRLRGRGLDFAELRRYRPGDDIRTMDWKATRRTGKPHVRLYTEEKERPVLLLVDQRLSMFFGSQLQMKSVTAAQAAALAAWRVVASGDRVGAICFNDKEIREIRPQRSAKSVLHILRTLVAQNNELRVDGAGSSRAEMLNRAMKRANNLAGHDYLICLISDFFGLDHETIHQAKLLSRHNDLLLLPVYDPLAGQLPEQGQLTVSDGSRQLRLDSREPSFRRRFPELLRGRLDRLTRELAKFGVPILPLHTAEPVAGQVREILGQRPGLDPRAMVVLQGVR
ncbi:MAG: DUF58 domain-containing protein [Thermodesulfobacteriota bacterium]